jgi:hypothetical protein
MARFPVRDGIGVQADRLRVEKGVPVREPLSSIGFTLLR